MSMFIYICQTPPRSQFRKTSQNMKIIFTWYACCWNPQFIFNAKILYSAGNAIASFTLYAALIIKEAMDVTLSHINLTCKEILS